MASRLQGLITRAVMPSLGNLKNPAGGSSGGKKGPIAGTRSVTFQSPGMRQILDQDAEAFNEAAYLSHVYVMRCVQTIANTIAGLEFRAGPDPMDPATHDPSAPLAQLLGPSTPAAPGGPNITTSSRAFWAWTICQYIVYGKWAWETQLDQKQIVALWPLVAACISAIPTDGGQQMWNGFEYQTPASIIKMKNEQVVYAWKPSLQDWRVPETVLGAAKLPITIAQGLDKYMANLLRNDMVATTMIVAPPFDEPDGQRAWEDQFLTSYSGVDKAGSSVFAYAERDEDDTTGQPLVQVERIAQTSIEAGLMDVLKEAKIDITIALGVPLSLIGNASQRTYANADSEYKNFWTITILPLISDIQDHVNTFLATRLPGNVVGWFDLSKVAALQPPAMFAPPMIGDVINFGVASAPQIANVLGIPAINATSDADSETVEVGQESSQIGPGGSRSAKRLGGVTGQQLLAAYFRFQNAPRNSHTYQQTFPEVIERYLEREHIDVRTPVSTPQTVRNDQAISLLRSANHIEAKRTLRQRQERLTRSAKLAQRVTNAATDFRATATADRTTTTVHNKLAEHYPESVLGWVDDADWDGPKQVPLDQIDMARRPGGRDQDKVKGIAKGIAAGVPGALAPIVLVKTPGTDLLKVADGFHRTKAHERLNHAGVNAYVGTVDQEEGPWDGDMHEAKLNRLAELKLEYRGDPRAPQKCKKCAKPATKSIIWAEGAAYVPVCDDHMDAMVNHIGGPNEVNEVKTIEEDRNWAEWNEEHHPTKVGRFKVGDRVHYFSGSGTLTHAMVDGFRKGPRSGPHHYVSVKRISMQGSAKEYVSNSGAIVDPKDLEHSDPSVFFHPSGEATPKYADHMASREPGEVTVFDGVDFDAWFDANSVALEQAVAHAS